MSEKLWDDGEEIGTQPSNHEESSLDPEQEYYRDEVDAPAAIVERMRAAAAARGEGRLNAFSAKKILREFGSAMSAEPGQRKTRAQRVDMRALGGYTTSGEDSRDPKPLDGVISYLIRSRGWKEPVAVSSVMARWGELVGPELATHAKPRALRMPWSMCSVIRPRGQRSLGSCVIKLCRCSRVSLVKAWWRTSVFTGRIMGAGHRAVLNEHREAEGYETPTDNPLI